jgi:type II restriction/modification system DNA methylase subunit YeeA
MEILQTIEENLTFIANALGNKGKSSRDVIRKYFLNDFFKDHCQNYSVTGSGKRPIYWLYDSGKQNGFKALIYMHRMDENTTGKVRADYLHRMEQIYNNEVARMQDVIDHSNSAHEVSVAEKRMDKLKKQIKEC